MTTTNATAQAPDAITYRPPAPGEITYPTATPLDPGVPAPNPPPNNWMSALGTTLMNVAPEIANISNPDQAKALAKAAVEMQAAQANKAETEGQWDTHFDPRSGIATQTHSVTGDMRHFPYAAPKGADDGHWVVIGTDQNGNNVHGYQPTREEYVAQQAKKAVLSQRSPAF